jgi:hypothetical protein
LRRFRYTHFFDLSLGLIVTVTMIMTTEWITWETRIRPWCRMRHDLSKSHPIRFWHHSACSLDRRRGRKYHLIHLSHPAHSNSNSSLSGMRMGMIKSQHPWFPWRWSGWGTDLSDGGKGRLIDPPRVSTSTSISIAMSMRVMTSRTWCEWCTQTRTSRLMVLMSMGRSLE